jgi:menaquinone-dependent protoporphyrinogen oxidase
MERSVLIAYASRHGATAGIAQHLATALTARNVAATALPIGDIKDAHGYDGYVIGSAVYAGRWLRDATNFVHENRTVLRRHPVWLFSSGPLSTDPMDRKHAIPRGAGKLTSEVAARTHQVFPGAWHRDAKPIGAVEKVMSLVPAARNALPEGDFRDWADLEAYAEAVAGELEAAARSE